MSCVYLVIDSNVERYPDNDVFRRVRVSSEQFTSKIWQYSDARQFLARSGWVEVYMCALDCGVQKVVLSSRLSIMWDCAFDLVVDPVSRGV